MNKGTNTIVETAGGKVKGTYENRLFVFKGIPYAAPPIGKRRWMLPEKHEPWGGVFEALKFGAISPRFVRPSTGGVQVSGFDYPEPQSEDCLFLNIWSPGLDGSKRPVMVWIHGGGFIFGSGSQPSYRGDILASRGDVVVVTINYRQGLLGFMNLNEVTGGRVPATGNQGLFDQIAALRWVRENIAAFGGNPANVTVFGESAGAMSIGCLMAMPAARGLFQKGILESGTGSFARPLARCVSVSKDFLEITGLKSDDVKGLQSLPVERIIEAQQELTLKAPGGLTPVAPVIDGKDIPQIPIDAIRVGSAKAITAMVGNNLEECKIFRMRRPELYKVDEAGLVENLRGIIPSQHISKVIDTYKKARASRGESVTSPELLSAIQTDTTFRLPAVRVVEAQQKNGMSAYHYIFTWKSPAMDGMLGACHALEIGFIFGTCDETLCGPEAETSKLSRAMQDAWIAFARTGDPSTKGLGKWPPYEAKRNTMMIGRESCVEAAPCEEERSIWDAIGDARPVE